MMKTGSDGVRISCDRRPSVSPIALPPRKLMAFSTLFLLSLSRLISPRGRAVRPKFLRKGNEKEQLVQDAQFRVRALFRGRLFAVVDVSRSRLGVQPLLRTSKASFIRGVLAPPRAFRLRSATSAHRHPPVGFR